MSKDSYGEICKYFGIDKVEELIRHRQEKYVKRYSGYSNLLRHSIFARLWCVFLLILYYCLFILCVCVFYLIYVSFFATTWWWIKLYIKRQIIFRCVYSAFIQQYCLKFSFKLANISTLWGKKMHHFYFCNNFVKLHYILIIFDTQILKLICNKTATKLPASSVGCSHPTLWNETRVNLFITTVTFALKVMTVTEKQYSSFCFWLSNTY